MPKRSTDELFQLVKSLEKSEKRAFKLFATRHSGTTDLKMLQLFDALDALDEYDELALLRKARGLQKKQLPNLKAHLYKQILAALRAMRDESNLDLLLHEQLDNARILYNKGLYLQSLKVLDKLKEISREYNQVTFWLQALIFEKKIESLYITRSFESRAEDLVYEVNELNDRLFRISRLSNLALQLYGWYIKRGHARTSQEVQEIRDFFQEHLPADAHKFRHFYERLYYHQSCTWYAFILQDFLSYYRHTQQWTNLFLDSPFMVKVETLFYIKGLHNLLISHFMLRNGDGYAKSLAVFEAFAVGDEANANDNIRIQTFIYLSIARINYHFMTGTFTEGLKWVPDIEKGLKDYEINMDLHRILVFYYKIACLYFGHGDASKALEYLNRIIHWKVDLRTDLQCYARLLHLICHYELGNEDILEHLIRSVYRFMSKMQHLSVVEEAIFRFLRQTFYMQTGREKEGLIALRDELSSYEGSPLESRSFMYLDIISWLTSKIENRPVQDVMQENYRREMKERELKEKAG